MLRGNMLSNDEYFAAWQRQNTATLFSFKEGDELVCIQSGNTPCAQFEVVIAATDTQKGIFSARPFIAVTLADGSAFSCHASRFTPK